MSSERLSLLWRSAHRIAVSRAAAVLIASIAISVAAVAVASLRAGRAAQAAADAQAALLSATTGLDNAHVGDARFASRIANVRRLRTRGFMSRVDRVDWVERVTTAVRAERPLRFKIELGTDRQFPLPPDVQSWYDAQGLPGPVHVASELRLEVDGLHEVELRRLLERAGEAGGGEVRLEHCVIERRDDRQGLDARCTLRRHALLAPQAAPGVTSTERPA